VEETLSASSLSPASPLFSAVVRLPGEGMLGELRAALDARGAAAGTKPGQAACGAGGGVRGAFMRWSGAARPSRRRRASSAARSSLDEGGFHRGPADAARPGASRRASASKLSEWPPAPDGGGERGGRTVSGPEGGRDWG
jgi:hypothetical protein